MEGLNFRGSIAGSAVLTSLGNVGGFAIFSDVFGDEAGVPLETRGAASYVLAYDNTNGLVTGLALANATGQSANLTVTVRDDRGSVLQTGPIALAAHGHTSMVLTTGFPMSAGKRGTVEIDGSAGFSALGLFFTPAGNVTTPPAFALK